MAVRLQFAEDFFSWGRTRKTAQRFFEPGYASETAQLFATDGEERLTGSDLVLPYGMGRSYGDSCLNHGGIAIASRNLNHFISWDSSSGVVRCECGVSLHDLIRFSVPRGWFIPVSPGTQFVTIGGAIANDVHGKNHHRAGSFGCFVKSIQLLRSDGAVYRCSAHENSALYRATIGGLGLTGFILSAEIQLTPIESPWICVEELQFRGLDEFFEISKQSAEAFEYTVAWLDCVSSGASFGRGIFMRGNFAKKADLIGHTKTFSFESGPRVSVPCMMPRFVLNSLSMRAFNSMYFHKQRSAKVRKVSALTGFFYPLDSVGAWNRLYGSSGFFQFQCVLAYADAARLLKELLIRVVRSGRASFLAVLKEFGSVRSPGLLSFPRPGVTVCLDFANRGRETSALLHELEKMVSESGGALYPAKDAVMTPETFEAGYRHGLSEFVRHKDIRFSSDFWRRVHG